MIQITLKKFKYTILFLEIILISGVISLFFEKSICIFYRITGIPCPSCGYTRGVVNILDFEFYEAYLYNPTIYLIPIILIIIFIGDLTNKLYIKILIFITVIIFVVWILRLIFFFPNEQYMSIDMNAPLIKIIKKY